MNDLTPPAEKAVNTVKHRFGIHLTHIVQFFLALLILIITAGLIMGWISFMRIHQHTALQIQSMNFQNQQLQKDFLEQTKQIERISQLTDQQGSQINQLNQSVGENQPRWIIEKATNLLQLANFTLLYEKNISTTIALLKAADNYLKPLSSQEILAWRDKISQRMAMLQAVPILDIPGIYLQLKALDEQSSHLKLTEDRFHSAALPLKNQKDSNSLSRWHQLKENLMQLLKTLIVVRHHDQAITPFLSDQLQEALHVNLHILFSQAEWALLHQECTVFQASLNQIQALLKQYFLQTDSEVQALHAAVLELNHINLSPSMPDLSDMTAIPSQLPSKQKDVPA